ncbi:MAG: phosphatidate cytidylyltransferase [Oscillospiraceae bacterium]|jgi:phosphatidate cytidylyltransferase|nr:phosphatidate cytidylyltransferase [Oscillospiraceae bacterium]
MKIKVIAGLVGIVVAAGALFLLHTLLPVALLAGFAGIAAFELLKSLSVKSRRLHFLAVLSGAAMPFLAVYYQDLPPHIFPAVIVGVFLIFLLVMLSDFQKISLVHTLAALAGGVLIPLGISSFILIRDFVPASGKTEPIPEQWVLFWILYGLFCCWVTDIFAYLVGKATGGKHKMTPHISPNKSWEGAVGGVLITALANGLLWLIFTKCGWFGDFTPSLGFILGFSPVLSALGILGDLTFSAIKRQTGIKDFGNLIPGHGGSLDRFDSFLFVMPTVWATLWLVYT